MSFFGVTIETLKNVRHHPNADRLDIASLENCDFSFVIGRDQFKSGDKVLYFPIDSLIPNEILKKLGLEGKLAGKEKNRVKSIRLRNEISQGIVASLDLISTLSDRSPESITKFLGVTKYEPPAILEKCGNLLPLPVGLSAYDIEGCERYSSIIEQLLDQNVAVTEKLEGSNFSVTYSPMLNKFFVNQRNYTIEEIVGKEHTWWKTVRSLNLLEKIKDIFVQLVLDSPKQEPVTLYGEMCGPSIQGNIYKLNQHTIFFFDIKYGSRYLNFEKFVFFTNKYNIQTVPILWNNNTLRKFLDGKSVKEASNGKSILNNNTRREGIVIKPYFEQFCPELSGRMILKQRSPEYLAQSEN